MKKYFILGTDTDCGKTHVTCQLTHYLRQNNHNVLAIKPIATGCEKIGDKWLCEDTDRLNLYNRDNIADNIFWRFKPPVSPHIAADEVGINLSADIIAARCNKLAENTNLDYLLIEGAGGLMVPLNREETWIDFLKATQIPVILVIGMRTGCINHALLTKSVLDLNKIECKGWVANCLDLNMPALEENITTLKTKLGWPMFFRAYEKLEMRDLNLDVVF